MSNGRMTDDEFKRIEARWKSDVDLRLSDGAAKLDRLLAFAAKYEAYLESELEQKRQLALMRRAIIEKSLVALIWACIVGAGTLFWQGAKAWLATK